MSGGDTLASLLVEGIRRLRATPAGASPELDAGLLLALAVGMPRARLRSHPEDPVDLTQVRDYRALLERRAAGEPLAYLTGKKEFWSLQLGVTPDVLIPRPETELLVERALALGTRAELRLADLGTGSGAVALALAHERPQWRISATDLSAPALAVARANAARLGLDSVTFRLGHWFEPLAGERFDLLVSNPPYVAADDHVLAGSELACEPRLALTPGADALECLEALARGAAPHLLPGGWLLLEHGADQGEAVRRALVLAGFRHVRSHRDLAGRERVTEGQHG
ncbi:MAG TPA: peptide chain release factor N(5)-glutamine methyltransferase [Steroidobacteraceae bacterium]|nr:peptide chain release factor N(5)-glutamine methyltransferase [Steroidobacteraceae bacterium]